MFSRSLAISLVLALGLTGCGTNPAGASAKLKKTAPAASTLVSESGATVKANAPAVSLVAQGGAQLVAQGGAQLVPQGGAHMKSSITVTGSELMSDDELKTDALSLGFSLASVEATGKTGTVRRTTTGWALEVTTGVFTTTTTDYALSGTAGVMAQIAAHENKKAKLTGTLDDSTNALEVSTVKDSLDLSVLTNWLTKGKFDGVVKDAATRLPIAGATVEATSTTGSYVFTQTTDATGEFAIKCLEPGDYTLSIVGAGYTSPDPAGETLKARQKMHLEFDLAQ